MARPTFAAAKGFVRRWLFVFGATGSLFLLFWYPHCDFYNPSAIGINQVEVSEQPAPSGGELQMLPFRRNVTLPHIWKRTGTTGREASYHATFHLSELPDDLWAVYLPSMNMSGTVWINGRLVGQGRWLTGQVPRQWNYPQYYFIDSASMRPGRNEVVISLVSDPPGSGLLAPFFVGSDRALRGFYEENRFFRVTLTNIIIGFSLTVSGFMVVLWILRPRETIHGWFALAILVWCIHNLNLVVVDLPVSRPLWDWLWFASIGWFVIVVAVFIHRFLGYRRRRVELLMLIAGALGTAILLVLALWNEPLFYRFGLHVWDTAALGLGIYPAVMMINANRHVERFQNQLLLVSGLLILMFGFHDWLVLNTLMECTHGFLMQFSAPIVIAAFAWILLRRFVKALEESELLNRELERRVANKTAELSAQYEKTRELAWESMISRERDRIMFDIHDGVGGELVSLLALASSGRADVSQVVEGLRTALDDLRMVINSLDGTKVDMGEALGVLRGRFVPRLMAKGIDVSWPVQSPPEFTRLTPEQVYQIAHILQEALTNVIKHAQASLLRFAQSVVNDSSGVQWLIFEITDNGQGVISAGNGLGMVSMRRRAKSLGAVLEVVSTPGRMSLRLKIPL